jgi:hypothetical protein
MSDKGSTYSNGGLFMAANAIPTLKLNVNTERANESCVPVTLKQRLGKLLWRRPPVRCSQRPAPACVVGVAGLRRGVGPERPVRVFPF